MKRLIVMVTAFAFVFGVGAASSAAEKTIATQKTKDVVVTLKSEAGQWKQGKNEITEPAGGKCPMASIPRHSAISLAWVSCTPLGGPVVPEV